MRLRVLNLSGNDNVLFLVPYMDLLHKEEAERDNGNLEIWAFSSLFEFFISLEKSWSKLKVTLPQKLPRDVNLGHLAQKLRH